MFYWLKKYYKLLILGFILGLIIFLSIKGYISVQKLLDLVNAIKGSPYAPFIYVFIYIAGVVLALPGIALTALSGPIFGFWKGALLVIISSNLGCQLTFFISRFMGRDFVKRFIKEDSMADRISRKIENNGFLVMLYLRILPIFPFNGVNYVSGLTNIRYRDYTLASFIGMLPGTLVYVYLSATAADIKDNPVGLIISIGTLILFTVVTTVIRKKQKIF